MAETIDPSHNNVLPLGMYPAVTPNPVTGAQSRPPLTEHDAARIKSILSSQQAELNDKENSVFPSSSSSSLHKLQAPSSRRSSVGHPLSPSSNSTRSRPNSFSATQRSGNVSGTTSPRRDYRRSLVMSNRNSTCSGTSSVEPASTEGSPTVSSIGLPTAAPIAPGSGEDAEQRPPKTDTSGTAQKRTSQQRHQKSSSSVDFRGETHSLDSNAESEASESNFHASPRKRVVSETRSTATLRASQRLPESSPMLERTVRVRDFAFTPADPRFKGEAALPDAINIPSAGHEFGGWYSPGTGALSSSSSSSLDGDHPPFGSFGTGHAYHRPQTGRSSWMSPNLPSTGQPSTSTSKYSWNFITEAPGSEATALSSSTGSGGISSVLNSALRIDDFDDSDDEREDGEFHTQSGPNIADGYDTASTEPADESQYTLSHLPAGGLLYKAAYTFHPEAPQEMAITEGDVVRVWEQLCDGWVVGGKVSLDVHGNEIETEDAESGLIPQNYLVLYKEPASSERSTTPPADHPPEVTWITTAAS